MSSFFFLSFFSKINKPLCFPVSVHQHILPGLTCVSHGAEDALGDGHDGVRCLVIAANWLAPGCVVTDVLQEVFQSLTHHAGCCTHLQDKRSSSSSIVNISTGRLKFLYIPSLITTAEEVM